MFRRGREDRGDDWGGRRDDRRGSGGGRFQDRDRDAPTQSQKKIDREKTCPFLLRAFVTTGGHHSKHDFDPWGTVPKDDEFHLYTWPDATLGEIADLVKEAYTPARQPDYALSMAIIHPDRSGHVIMRNVGFVDPTRPNQDVEKKVLGETGFQPGDLLDVSVEKQHM